MKLNGTHQQLLSKTLVYPQKVKTKDIVGIEGVLLHCFLQ